MCNKESIRVLKTENGVFFYLLENTYLQNSDCQRNKISKVWIYDGPLLSYIIILLIDFRHVPLKTGLDKSLPRNEICISIF